MLFHQLSLFLSPRSNKSGLLSVWISLAPWSWIVSASPLLWQFPSSWCILTLLSIPSLQLQGSAPSLFISACFSGRAAWSMLLYQDSSWNTIPSSISSLSCRRRCAVGTAELFLPCPCLSDFILAVSGSNQPVLVPIFRSHRLLARCVFGYCHGTF